MKRLLIITENFPPSNSIGTQRILRITKYLDRSRWEIHVLTLKEKYFWHENGNPDSSKSTFSDNIIVHRTGKWDVLFILSKVRQAFRNRKIIPIISSFFFPDNSVNKKKHTSNVGPNNVSVFKKAIRVFTDFLEFPDKNVTWIPLAVLKGFKLIRKKKIDVIFSTSPRHSIHLTTAILKILTKRRLVIDFRDPWARSPWRDQGRSSTHYRRLRHRIIQKFEKFVVERADKVVSVTAEIKNDFALTYSHIPPQKFEVFYNGYDPAHIRISHATKANNQKIHTPKVTFVHTGTLYRRRDPSPLFYAIRNLVLENKIDPEIALFQFVGAISDSLIPVKNLVTELQIDQMVQFIPPVDYEKSFDYMLNSDVLILLQPFTKLQIPGKFYDYLCLGKPIFAIGENGGAVQNIMQNRFGLFVDYHKIDHIMTGILRFLQNPKFNSETIKLDRERFDISKSIDHFDQILYT